LVGIIDFMMSQSFERDEQYRQTLMAQKLQAQIHAALEEHVTALIALNVVYQNFVDITHYDFQQYGKSITSHLSGFRRLFYVDPGLNIRHVYPYSSENKWLVDQSLRPQGRVAQLLQHTRTTRKPGVSDFIPFLDHSHTVLAVTPIYRNNKEFLGYAVGELSIENMWKPIAQSDFMKDYQVQLEDSSGNRFFSGVNLSNGDRIFTSRTLPVADQQWKLLFQSKGSSFEELTMQRIILWSTALLIMVLFMLLITGTKRHKQALGKAQKQFETIFNASPDGIILLDDKLKVQLANPAVREWTGLNEEELAKKSFFDLFACHCPHLAKCGELSHLLCTSGQFAEGLPDVLEAQLRNTDGGTNRTMRLNASKISNVNGDKRQEGFICVMGDISTSKELDRVKENYIATLTHDLKTPLLAQEMVLNTLLGGTMGEVNQDQRRLLSGATDSVRDLLEMVNSTLLFYKLEASHLALNKQRIPLASPVRDVLETLQPLAEKRNLKLELETSMDMPDVMADVIQLKRVFHNILSNAISYSFRDSTIHVAITPDGADRLQVMIANQGKGITAEELPRVFEKYHSLSKKFKQIGTGLGLYISRRIVELHGGKIWVESEPNEETRFYVSLPCPQLVGMSDGPQQTAAMSGSEPR
jgi:PAS domain S-box-containing protein